MCRPMPHPLGVGARRVRPLLKEEDKDAAFGTDGQALDEERPAGAEISCKFQPDGPEVSSDAGCGGCGTRSEQ